MIKNEIRFLPSLKEINIKNYSLYPGDLNLSYKFINGVNLIIGGNGVGKTTFLNILKYALIGLYKKDLDVKRRELQSVEYRTENRQHLPYDYFEKRMDKSVDYNEKAEVTLTFELNKKTFMVTRNLAKPGIMKVIITEGKNHTELDGKNMTQAEFDTLFSQKKRNEEALRETLQWKYEDAVGRASNHEMFDNIIFIVNEILFFNESRKTIMWDSIAQDRLSSKYFIDPKLDEKREEAAREAKYQNSLSRHKGEDIRAIRKIFDKIEGDDTKNKEFKNYVTDIENEKKNIAILFNDLESIQSKRASLEVTLSKTHSEKNSSSKKLEDIENQKRKEEELIFTDLFRKVTPKYYDYKRFLKSSGSCPLCNNSLQIAILEKIKSDDEHCMMCGNDIRNPELSSPALTELKKKLNEVQLDIRNKEKKIIELDEDLKMLDTSFRETTISLNKSQSILRQLQFAIQKSQVDDNSKVDSEYKAMNARIEELEKEKEEARIKSSDANLLAKQYDDEIDTLRLESREQLSGIFNQFGSKFLGVQCELVYDDPDGGNNKRYYPKIGNIERVEEDELSESQRFFIDQSFRMSILSYFNTESSFFMCETPDSSLDLSYEKNAAKVFLEYLKQPNELILTSNLNNSDFLEYLIGQSSKINYINLLTIGKQSTIQASSTELKKASSKIEQMINEKRR